MSTDSPSIIRRPDIGLAITGTRITLYTVMDYLSDGWSVNDIAALLGLTTSQMRAALDYIETHRAEVEAEYNEVIQEAEERQRFWEAHLRDQLARQPQSTLSPEKAALYARLAEQRAQTIRDLVEDD